MALRPSFQEMSSVDHFSPASTAPEATREITNIKLTSNGASVAEVSAIDGLVGVPDGIVSTGELYQYVPDNGEPNGPRFCEPLSPINAQRFLCTLALKIGEDQGIPTEGLREYVPLLGSLKQFSASGSAPSKAYAAWKSMLAVARQYDLPLAVEAIEGVTGFDPENYIQDLYDRAMGVSIADYLSAVEEIQQYSDLIGKSPLTETQSDQLSQAAKTWYVEALDSAAHAISDSNVIEAYQALNDAARVKGSSGIAGNPSRQADLSQMANELCLEGLNRHLTQFQKHGELQEVMAVLYMLEAVRDSYPRAMFAPAVLGFIDQVTASIAKSESPDVVEVFSAENNFPREQTLLMSLWVGRLSDPTLSLQAVAQKTLELVAFSKKSHLMPDEQARQLYAIVQSRFCEPAQENNVAAVATLLKASKELLSQMSSYSLESFHQDIDTALRLQTPLVLASLSQVFKNSDSPFLNSLVSKAREIAGTSNSPTDQPVAQTFNESS